MSSINRGVQKLLFSFRQEVTAEGFNQLNHKLHPHGIYIGGELSILSDVEVQVARYLTIFEDVDNKVSIRIESNDVVNQTITTATPFIILRFEWINSATNFIDILNVAEVDIEDTDIVLGRGIFNSTTLIGFDYSRKSWSYSHYHETVEYNPPFKVIANEPYNDKVTVMKSSPYLFNGKLISLLVNTLSPVFAFPIGVNGRTDVLCINNLNVLSIIQGAGTIGAPIPIIPSDKLPIAIISFPSSASAYVRGDYITYIHPDKYLGGSTEYLEDVASTPNTLALRDSNGDLTSRVIKSDVAIGTAPLSIVSTTKVNNLNVDLLNGQTGTYYVDKAIAYSIVFG